MKTALRNKFKALRASLDKAYVKKANKGIFKNIINLPEFQRAKTVFVYLSFNSEADTGEIIDYCKNMGKKVLVPVTYPKEKKMIASVMGELKQGAYGIPEPVEVIPVDKEDIDFIIVPGLAFTRDGHRMGYGGGYYDRFLADFTGFTAGLCYSRLITDDVLSQSHDIAVNAVITEDEVLR